MHFTNSTWADLPWTEWVRFSDVQAFKKLPASAGVYRVRPVGVQELFYIGQTGRDLRERLRDLRSNTLQEVMPFNDPHTAAPSLWAWRHAEGFAFECSVAPVQLAEDEEEARRLREGLEFYLLWLYRLEFGSSTRCNHGRFHPRYRKSTDRKKGVRGDRIPDNNPSNPAGGPSLPPLPLLPSPVDERWMGLTWHPVLPLQPPVVKTVGRGPGVYKILDSEKKQLLYIGESQDLRDRLLQHVKKSWQRCAPQFSFVRLPEDTPGYQRREIENDLLGGFYAQTRQIPTFQLLNHRQLSI